MAHPNSEIDSATPPDWETLRAEFTILRKGNTMTGRYPDLMELPEVYLARLQVMHQKGVRLTDRRILEIGIGYAKMMLTRNRINALIQSINDRLTNPPSDNCGPLPPLPLFTADTVLKREHIETLRDSLTATCGEIEFGKLPAIWIEAMIQESNQALSAASCDCLPPT